MRWRPWSMRDHAREVRERIRKAAPELAQKERELAELRMRRENAQRELMAVFDEITALREKRDDRG